MALGFLVPQQFTAPVILLVTGVTLVLLLWRSTRGLSTGKHVGVIPILASKGLTTVGTRRGPPLTMLFEMLVKMTLAVIGSTTVGPGARELLPLWIMCSLVEFQGVGITTRVITSAALEFGHLHVLSLNVSPQGLGAAQ